MSVRGSRSKLFNIFGQLEHLSLKSGFEVKAAGERREKRTGVGRGARNGFIKKKSSRRPADNETYFFN